MEIYQVKNPNQTISHNVLGIKGVRLLFRDKFFFFLFTGFIYQQDNCF